MLIVRRLSVLLIVCVVLLPPAVWLLTFFRNLLQIPNSSFGSLFSSVQAIIIIEAVIISCLLILKSISTLIRAILCFSFTSLIILIIGLTTFGVNPKLFASTEIFVGLTSLVLTFGYYSLERVLKLT
jgi:hypothetical protein